MQDSLPKDDFILLSLVNTKLRDGESLEDFCAEYSCSSGDICRRMKNLGYVFDDDENKFKRD